MIKGFWQIWALSRGPRGLKFRDFSDSRDSSSEKTPFVTTPFSGAESEELRAVFCSLISEIAGKSHPWTNASVGGNFRRTFRTIGPYEFPPKKIWTNGAQSSLKVTVLTGIGPYHRGQNYDKKKLYKNIF